MTMIKCFPVYFPGEVPENKVEKIITEDGEPIEKKIIKAVCKYLGTDYIYVMGKNRNREFIESRQYAMYFIRELGWTASATGKIFGRDHTTVVNARKQLEALVTSDKGYRKRFFELRDIIDELCGIAPVEEEETIGKRLDNEAEMILNCQNENQGKTCL